MLGIICRRNQLRSCVPLFRIKNSNDNEGIEADFKSAECSPITLFTALPARKNRPLVICYRHLFTFDGNNYCVEKLLLIELGREKKEERGDKKIGKVKRRLLRKRCKEKTQKNRCIKFNHLRERREKKKKEKTRRLIFVISNASLRINRTAIHHETLQLCSNEVSLKLIKDRISSSLYYIYPFILFSMYLHCIFVQLYLRSGVNRKEIALSLDRIKSSRRFSSTDRIWR